MVTKTYHSKPYPAISPFRPELSAAGKNVVVTGGGSGIGKAIAIAFAQAGAKSVSIVGRLNVRSALNAIQVFIPLAEPDATIISVSSAAAHIRPMVGTDAGAYSATRGVPVRAIHVCAFSHRNSAQAPPL